jgi:hypothetical protein
MLAVRFRHAGDVAEIGRLRPVKHGPHSWRWIGLALLIVVIGLGLIAIQLAVIGSALIRARDDFEAGRFTRAQTEFDIVGRGLRHSWLLAPLRLVPPVNRQLEAAALMANLGAHGSHAAAAGMAAANSQDLTALSSIEADLQAMAVDRSNIPHGGLAPQLEHALQTVDPRLRQAEALLPMLPVIRQIIGSQGSASYLVLQQDPAELRATGGFIGSVAFLEFEQGKMQSFEPVDIETIDGPHFQRTLGVVGSPTYIKPPWPFFRVLDPGDSWELRDENFSPDFPSSARLAEFFLQRETGRRVEGVIAIDPYLISNLLAVTGPVKVPETDDVLTAQNFYETTLRSVELHQGPTPRKSFLSYASAAVFGRLKTMSAQSWLQVASIVQEACLSKHIQAYFDDPATEAIADRYGCAGKVPVFKSDGLMVVDENLNSNKDDFWISRSYQLTVEIRSDGSARHTLQITYGPYPQLEQLTTPYIDWLRIYVPDGSHLISAGGTDAQQDGDLGNTVIRGWVQYNFGQTHEVTIVYEVPRQVMGASGLYQLTWLKQAGRASDPLQLTVSRAPSGRPLTVTSDLRRDRSFSFR